MNSLSLAIELLNLAASAAESASRARRIYDEFKAQAQRDKELTELESADLDARAAAIFDSPASEPSGR